MDYSGLSIIELKQLLARVNHDLKMNKPTLNRAAKKASKALSPIISEYAECNIIAQRFTNKQHNQPIQNGKIIQDIQIQKDILAFIHNGGQIITRKSRKNIKPLTVSSSIISL
jgi:hypothetical protein